MILVANMVKEIRFYKFKRLAMWTKGLLWYGICARCKKQAPVVRGAFSEEHCTGKSLFLLAFVVFGAGNALLFFWQLQNSVPERAFSGTEYACCAKKGFLRYATRFLKPSVLKTGFWGTEGIFGTGNALLRYGVHLQSAGCLASPHVAPQKEKSASG